MTTAAAPDGRVGHVGHNVSVQLRSVLAVGAAGGRRLLSVSQRLADKSRRLLDRSRRLPGSSKRLLAQGVAALAHARLRAERLVDRLRGTRRSRILATACGQFPIYSQTFVYQEVCALAERGFSVRFSYSTLGERSHLPPRFDRLWRLKRRMMLKAHDCSDDFRHYEQRMPDKVEALSQALCEASGLSRTELVRHEHFLQAFSFTRIAEAWRPDYLHSYFFYERTLFTLVASWLLGIPRGVSCYADHMLDDYPLKLVALNVRHSDVVVATSRRIKRELEAICGSDALPHVIVKPNGIDTRQFGGVRSYASQSAPASLVSVCRLEPKKGLRYLVEAMALLRDQGVGVQLHILGAPDDHDHASLACAAELKAQVARQDLGSVVIFEGRRTGPEVRQFLSQADVFVAPFVELENGDKDGISTAVFEAMASGCAIVATDSGSTTEAIEAGQDGLIVAQRDPGQLAAAICTLLSDQALRERLGRSAAARAVREFDVAQCEEVFHEHVRNAIHRRAS